MCLSPQSTAQAAASNPTGFASVLAQSFVKASAQGVASSFGAAQAQAFASAQSSGKGRSHAVLSACASGMCCCTIVHGTWLVDALAMVYLREMDKQ